MILITIISIGAVSAADNTTNDSLTTADQDILSADEPGSFTDLRNEINGNLTSGKSIMNLTRDYLYQNTDNFKAIEINGKITINGNNHTLDANHKYGIFNITASDVILNNITFKNANATSFDLYRAVNVYGANCIINNSYFYGNTMSSAVDGSQGGAIYWNGENGTLLNSVFVNNSRSVQGDDFKDRGGAVFWHGDDGRIINCTFRNNSAREGGAVSWGLGGTNKNGLIYKCIFDNNYAWYHGMAVMISSPNVTIIESNFTNNTGTYSAIYAENYGPYLNISHCIFNENKAIWDSSFYLGNYSGSPAIELQGYRSYVEYCDFINNSATIKGNGNQMAWAGAVKVHGKADDTIIDHCNFINNYAKAFGAVEWQSNNGIMRFSNFTNNKALNNEAGAIRWDGKNGTVLECIFENNTAKNEAGAIQFTETSENSKVINSTFTNNIANTSNGGAIHWKSKNGTVIESIFENNTAFNNGGAILFSDISENCKVINSTFTNNIAENKRGGAICWDTSFGIVYGSNFTGNHANKENGGGAIFFQGKNETILESIFEDNFAKRNGGAIVFASNSENSKVINSTFTNNIAEERNGGAICWDTNNGIVSGSNFTNNQAKSNNGGDYCGGAIYFQGKNEAVLECRFENNTAHNTGGAIVFTSNSANSKIINSTFTNNIAEQLYGGAIRWDTNDGTVYGSNFTENHANNNYGGVLSIGVAVQEMYITPVLIAILLNPEVLSISIITLETLKL